MAHRVECFRKAIIAGDTCHEGVLYRYTHLAPGQWLFIRLRLFQSDSILVELREGDR